MRRRDAIACYFSSIKPKGKKCELTYDKFLWMLDVLHVVHSNCYFFTKNIRFDSYHVSKYTFFCKVELDNQTRTFPIPTIIDIL